jgi:hypothetical protein
MFLFHFFAVVGFTAEYVVTERKSDGTIFKHGFRKGYPVKSTLKVEEDGTVVIFQLSVTAVREASVEGLFRAAGLEMEIKYDDAGFVGQPRITSIENVAGGMEISIDEQTPFQTGNVGTQLVQKGQKVTICLTKGLIGVMQAV